MSEPSLDESWVMSGNGAAVGRGALPWWVRTVAVAGALLMGLGGVIALVHPAMLVSPQDQVLSSQGQINEAVRIYAGYMASRNLVLAALVVGLLGVGARRPLAQWMMVVGFVQLVDACLDAVAGRWAVLPGVLVLGVVFLAASARTGGAPFWRSGAWR
jgi:hypothetical protein